MSNIVRTWENEANPAGEIELTDAQLAAVYGAWDNDCQTEAEHKEEFHKECEKKVKVHFKFEFDFEKEIKKEKECKKDWDC
jgi:hypothetical protein